MADLEKDIGELKGTLKGFVPTVEKISNRVDENRDKITAVETDLGLHKKEVWRTIVSLEVDGKDQKKEAVALHTSFQSLERDVQELERRGKGIGKFMVRVAEMLVAALIGGAAALFFGG